MTDKVNVNTQELTVTVPHLGLTLRSIFGAAVKASHSVSALAGRRPRFKVLYKNTVIGEIRLKDIGEADAR